MKPLDYIYEYDGKHTEPLELARKKLKTSEIDELITLIGSPEVKIQDASSWVLMRYLETDGTITPSQVLAVISHLDTLIDWGAKLHICQLLHNVTIPPETQQTVRSFLETQITSPRPFVRAWAYSGLAELITQFGADESITRLLSEGQHDESAAVRARLRNLPS